MFFLLHQLKQRFKGLPWVLLLVLYTIIALGLYNLYSSTNAAISPSKFYDQMIFIGIGTGFMFVLGAILDFRSIERMATFSYIFICILLLAVDIFGHNAKGAERWLAIGPIRLQPSEFAKFIIILIIAKSFSNAKGYQEFSLLSLWKQIALILFPFLLILAQPDLGTASLVLMIACGQLFTVKIRIKSLVSVGIIGLILALVSWNFILYDYQKQRVLTFINPMLDPRGSGYHSIQSMIAVGSGGLWGLGFSKGTQAKLQFLPERHTDFAFSVWAEEHGLFGCLILVFLFSILIIMLFQIANRAKEGFSCLVATGVAMFFMLHFLINIAMVLGVFPVVGVPLTLISYGGTHMITALSCIGLVVGIERKRNAAP